MSDGIERVAGTDRESGAEYVLLAMPGRTVPASEGVPTPCLVAQCWRDRRGTERFELLADEGRTPELSFDAPWVSLPGNLFPPRLRTVAVSMEFLGYRKEKPVKRQWQYLDGVAGRLRYAAPGLGSSNLEEVRYYLQYLRALPELHLSRPGEPMLAFETAAWQLRIKAEPLCRASGL